MEKQKKSVGAIALVILLLIVTIVSLVLATYAWAKYTTTVGPLNGTANVAKWNVTFNGDDSQFIGTFNHVVEGKIAPGTSGQITVTPVPNDTEVCFDYTISNVSIDLLDNAGNALDDSTPLVDGVTVGQVKSHITVTSNNTNLLAANATVGGTWNLTNENATPLTGSGTVLVWNWPYEGEGLANAISDAQNAVNDAQNAYNLVQNEQTTSDLATAQDALNAAQTNMANYDKIDTAAGKYSSANAVQNGVNGLRLRVNYTATATQVEPQQ